MPTTTTTTTTTLRRCCPPRREWVAGYGWVLLRSAVPSGTVRYALRPFAARRAAAPRLRVVRLGGPRYQPAP